MYFYFDIFLFHTPNIVSIQENFTKLPPILFFILKRFDFDPVSGVSHKNDQYYYIEKKVTFKTSKTSNDYRLFAVVAHQGYLDDGHYFTYVLVDPVKNTWIRFDDLTVTFASEYEARDMNYGGETYKQNAYMLFYVNEKNIDLIWADVLKEHIHLKSLRIIQKLEEVL